LIQGGKLNLSVDFASLDNAVGLFWFDAVKLELLAWHVPARLRPRNHLRKRADQIVRVLANYLQHIFVLGGLFRWTFSAQIEVLYHLF